MKYNNKEFNGKYNKILIIIWEVQSFN